MRFVFIFKVTLILLSMNIEKIVIENVFCFQEVTIPPEGTFGNLNCFIGRNDRGKSLVLKIFDMVFNGYLSKFFDNIRTSGSIDNITLNAKAINFIKDNERGKGTITIYIKHYKGDAISDQISGFPEMVNQYPILKRSNCILLEYSININDDDTGKFFRDRILLGNLNEDEWIDASDLGGLRDNITMKINEMFSESGYTLIPAIRNLEVEGQINVDRVWEVPPDGTGIANAVFEGINRPDLGKRRLIRKIEEDISRFTNFQSVLGVNVTNGRDIEFDEIPQSFVGDASKQMYISFFNLHNLNSRIIGFEEPESHLHPERQKQLLKYLEEYSKINNTQFFITTHSPFILDQFNRENVYCFKKSQNNIIVEKIENDDDLWDLLNLLGIKPHDMLQNDMTIFVEGPTDRKIIEIFGKTLGYDYDKFNINIVDLHGVYGNLEVEHLSKINRNFKVILCSHVGITERERDIEKIKTSFEREGKSVKLKILKKREIENYLSPRVIENEFKLKGGSVSINDSTEVREHVNSLIGNNEIRKWSKRNKVKIGQRIADNMTQEEIDSEIKILLNEIFEELKQDADLT